MLNLKGKWVLITGASRGIGKLSAVFMASQGCNLILHARTLEATETVENEVKKYGIETMRVCARLEDRMQVEDKAALNKVTIDLGYKMEGTDVILSLADPGWCRTDLGGPNAPNAPESTIPGIVVGAFIDDKKSGRLFPAQDFNGMSLEDAVTKAETYPSPYNN